MTINRKIKLDESEDMMIHGAFQNVEPLIDHNKALQNEWDGFDKKATFHRVASIPPILVEKWKNEHGVDFFNKDHWPKIVALLNDKEYEYLKTAPVVI